MKDNKVKTQVLVIGGGIIGISCAYYLNKAGYSVTVIDKNTIGSGCSHGSCGYVCPSHILPLTEPGAVLTGIKSFFDPSSSFRVKARIDFPLFKWFWEFAKLCNPKDMFAISTELKKLLDSSMLEYQELKKVLEANWYENGLLYVFQNEKALYKFSKKNDFLNKSFGVNAELLEGNILPTFDSALKSNLAGAYYYKNDAHLRPDKFITSWCNNLKQSGVNFIENCELLTLNKKNGVVTNIETSKGSMVADEYIMAAGALSAKMAKELNCLVPIQPAKGYSITVNRPNICPNHSMLFPEHGIGVTPFNNKYRIGSMMEFSGFDTSIPESRINQLKNSTVPYLKHNITNENSEKWFGWRPMTWDGLPIIGYVNGLNNVCMATGHSMLGISLAPVTGRLVSEIIQGKTTHISIAGCSPSRF